MKELRLLYAWHNFRTGETDYREEGSIEDYGDYVPQGAGRSLYDLYVLHEKMNPLEAALRVLSAIAGVPTDD